MVELDRMRANQLMRRAKARKNGELVKVDSTAAAAAAGQLSRGAAFQKSLEDKGFEVGGEFVAAIEEAQLLNATVLLGDRDINITIERVKEAEAEVRRLRAEGAISREVARAAADRVPSSLRRRTEGEELTADGVSQMRAVLTQRENARAVAAYMQRAAPPVYEAMIGERDTYMARQMLNAPSASMVAVVGLSHLDGLVQILGEEGGALQVRLHSCMQPGL